MKKLRVLLPLSLLILLLPCIALAGCWRHPDAGNQTNTHSSCQSLDNELHCYAIRYTETCLVCGEVVSEGSLGNAAGMHNCRRGVCIDCGHRVMSTGYDRDAIPNNLDPEAVAALLGRMTIGGSLRVYAAGSLYAAPSPYAYTVGSIHVDENFIVDDYQYAEGGSWFRVYANGQDAWVSASNARFLISHADSYIPGGDYSWLSGRTCLILTNRGNVRKTPGMDTRVVTYVYEGQVYTILSCQEGPDGKVWYRICVDGTYGWISSGLAQLQ